MRRSLAEYASVPQGQLVLKPTNLTFGQAAAVPISGFTALQALRDTGGAQPGKVVIIGASGGVGSFAVQLAKAFGAEVWHGLLLLSRPSRRPLTLGKGMPWTSRPIRWLVNWRCRH